MAKCACCAIARLVKPDHYRDQLQACRNAMRKGPPRLAGSTTFNQGGIDLSIAPPSGQSVTLAGPDLNGMTHWRDKLCVSYPTTRTDGA